MNHPWFDQIRAKYASQQSAVSPTRNMAAYAKKKSSFANSNKPMNVHQ